MTEQLSVKIDYKTKGGQEIKIMTERLRRLDDATGDVITTSKKYVANTGRVISETSRWNRANKKVTRSLHQMRGQTKGFNGSLFRTFTMAGLAERGLANLGQGFIDVARGGFNMLLDASKTTSKSMFDLNSVLANAEHGSAKISFEAIRKFAIRTGQAVGDTSEQLSNLMRRGFNARDAHNFVSLGADIASTMGDPRALGRVLNAIGQIQAKGRLQTEEILQLAEGGGLSQDLLFQALAKGRGIDFATPESKKKMKMEMQRLLEAGQIASEDAIPALRQAYLDMFNLGRAEDEKFTRPGERAAEYVEKTFPGALDSLKRRVEDTFLTVGGALSEPLAAATNRIHEMFAAWSENEDTVDGFNSVIDSIIQNLNDMPETVETIGRHAKALWDGFMGTNTEVEKSDSLMKSITNFLGNNTESTEKFGKEMGRVADAVLAAAGAFADMWEWIAKITGSSSFGLLMDTMSFIFGNRMPEDNEYGISAGGSALSDLFANHGTFKEYRSQTELPEDGKTGSWGESTQVNQSMGDVNINMSLPEGMDAGDAGQSVADQFSQTQSSNFLWNNQSIQ